MREILASSSALVRRYVWVEVAMLAAFVVYLIGRYIPSSAPETSDGSVVAMFAAVAVVQVVALGVLWASLPAARAGFRSPWWPRLSVWYYLGAVFAAGISGRLAAAGYPEFVTMGMAVGAFGLAATAHRCMGAWGKKSSARPDISVFLVGTQVLALLVCGAYLSVVVASSGDEVSSSVLTGGTNALTLLALPLCAGVWARLRVAEVDDPPPAPAAQEGEARQERQGDEDTTRPEAKPTLVDVAAGAVAVAVWAFVSRFTVGRS